MKSKISFVCQECGYESPQWLGKCPECGQWNTLKEFRRGPATPVSLRSQAGSSVPSSAPKKLHEIKTTSRQRLKTGFNEVDTVLGGGLVAGAVTLLAGDPGVGKSTLLLQLALNVAGSSYKTNILYISGEESSEQVKLRAERLLGHGKSIKKSSSDGFLLLSSTNTDAVVEVIRDSNPSLVVIDSIQTMESEAAGGLSGAVSQIRYGAATFIRVAKTLGIPFILVGHVTKEGMVAGPMVLSHMVDTVLFLEGEKTTRVRVLRSLKNRFGPVDEVGIFLMEEGGMQEVTNPEQLFLGEHTATTPGSVLVAPLEGSRAFLVEVQALVVYSKLPIPRRVGSGIDSKRLELLLAVLQKHCNLPVATMDVFVNVAGGMKLTDPACDLGICLAIYSSLKNVAIKSTVAISEIGLLGELRRVPLLEKRVKEAVKMGYKNIITVKKYKMLREVLGDLK